MGLFEIFKSKNKCFISKNKADVNLEKQLLMTPQTLEKLRELGVNEEKELKLEFFFYTNTIEKAELLADELTTLQYSVEYGESAGDRKLFIITGWSTKIKMDEDTVITWTKKMHQAGVKYDCEFDG